MYPLVVRKEDLFRKDVLPDWAFGSIILGDDKFEIRREANAWTLVVHPDEAKLGVYNTPGRLYLSRWRENIAAIHKGCDGILARTNSALDIHSTLKSGSAGQEQVIEGDEIKPAPKTLWRWSSGGVIPIVKWRGKRWVAFNWRRRPGVGLNLFAGSSESPDQLLHPQMIAWREFVEEFVVLEDGFGLISGSNQSLPQEVGPYHYAQLCFPSRGFNVPTELQNHLQSTEFLKDHSHLRAEQDGLPLSPGRLVKPSIVGLRDSGFPGHLRVEVKSGGTTLQGPEDMLFVPDMFSCGIDCVLPVEVELEYDDYLLNGEIWEGGGWSKRSGLVRDPVIFLNLEMLATAFSGASSKTGLVTPRLNTEFIAGNPETSYAGGRLLTRCGVDDFWIFDYDWQLKRRWMKHLAKGYHWRLHQAEARFLSRMESYWGNSFDALIALRKSGAANLVTHETEPFFTLCPISWKCLELLFASGYS